MSTEGPYQVMFCDEMAERARASGMGIHEVARYLETTIRSQWPIYLGIIDKVVYNHGTDRYVLHFGRSSVKATAEVAEFVLTNSTGWSRRGAKPTAYVSMEHGVAIGVVLYYLNKD